MTRSHNRLFGGTVSKTFLLCERLEVDRLNVLLTSVLLHVMCCLLTNQSTSWTITRLFLESYSARNPVWALNFVFSLSALLFLHHCAKISIHDFWVIESCKRSWKYLAVRALQRPAKQGVFVVWMSFSWVNVSQKSADWVRHIGWKRSRLKSWFKAHWALD